MLETVVTDENGEALTARYPLRDFKNLYLRETATNEFYKLNNEKIEVVLETEQIKNITVTNQKKKGKIEIVKVDKDNNEIKIPNVTFEVYDEDNNIVETLITDENGKAVSKLLPIDKEYTIKETNNENKNYKLTEETKKITLEEDKVATITFENEKRKGQIKVIKTDGETKIPLEEVVFVIKNSKGDVVDRIVTDENGEAMSKELPIDEIYTVYEEKSKNGYILSSEKQVVELKEEEISTLEFDNYKEKGTIKIIKVTSDGKNKEGIEFKITGTSLTKEYFEAIYKTNKEGEIFIDEVLAGEYTIEELKNDVNAGYIIPEAQTIKVENGKVSEVEFFNQLIETPKTADERNIILASASAIASLVGIIIFIFFRIKNKKK